MLISPDSATRRQVIQRLLSDKAGPGATPHAIAEAAVHTWTQAQTVLAQLIGENGVQALYARSLHLTQATYPWLATVEAPAPGPAPLSDLKSSLERRSASDAAEASSAFLAGFETLLISLIGEALSTRLLNSAWPDGDSGTTSQEIHP